MHRCIRPSWDEGFRTFQLCLSNFDFLFDTSLVYSRRLLFLVWICCFWSVTPPLAKASWIRLTARPSCGADWHGARLILPSDCYPVTFCARDYELCPDVLPDQYPSSSPPLPFFITVKLRGAGKKGEALALEQPWTRKDCAANMGGVDTADLQNGSQTHDK